MRSYLKAKFSELPRSVTKCLRGGLITILWLLMVPVLASAAPAEKITLKLDNAPMIEALEKIEEKTSYKLSFPHDEVQPYHVTCDFKDKSVSEALKIIFKSTPLTFEIDKEFITVFARQRADNSARVKQNASAGFLSGTVVDEGGTPLAGVAVFLKGDKAGVTTNVDGKFSISIKNQRAPYTLEFNYVGMKTQTISIAAPDKAITVTMHESAQMFNEVVVTGLFERKAGSFTGAATTFDEKDLARVGNQNVLQSLKNLDPTVYIPTNMSMGSDPNTLPEVSIRGTSSFPGAESSAAFKSAYQNQPNQPLFILDGFETTIETVMDMDMNRIKSLTVLKDASAKALYGSKAANGVIVIETKRLSGERPTITYSGSIDIEAPDLTSYDLCNAMEKLQAELNEGLYTNDINAARQIELTKMYNARYKLAKEGLDTYWLAKPLRTGIGQKHNLQVELGSPSSGLRALLDVSYNDVAGVMKDSYRKSLQGNTNISYRTNNLIFRNIMSVISNWSQDSPYGSFSDYTKMNPFWQATDINGNISRYAEGSNGYQTTNGSLSVVANPMYDATIGTSLKSTYLKFTNNFYAEWQVTDPLKLMLRVGVSQQINDADSFYPSQHSMFAKYTNTAYELMKRGKYILENGKLTSLSGDFSFNFNKQYGKHSVFVNGTGFIAETKSQTYQHVAEGFPNSSSADITFARQYAENSKPVGTSSLNREISFLAAFSYDFDNRYLFDSSFRIGASSLFGSHNRWSKSWSLGVGWNVHKEPFMRDQTLITQLKLRGSLGLTGNQNFSRNNALAIYQYYTDKIYMNQTGAYLTVMPNPDLKWEQKKDYNVGFDLRMWRLAVVGNLYIADTKDMLTSVSRPTSTGFATVMDNLGLVRNQGFDLTANVTVWQGRDAFVNVYGAIAYNKNKIIKLSESMRTYNESMLKLSEDKNQSQPVLMYEDGQSMNTIWAVPSAGIDPQTGQEIYIKKDGTLTYQYDSNDRVAAGISAPKYQGNFGFTAEWKGLGLSTTFTFLGGGQLYNSTLVDRVENVDMAYNVDRRVLTGRWTTPGQVTQFKKFDSYSSTRATTRFVQDRNELTWSSLSVYYDFPTSLLSHLRMQRLRLAYFMNDIFTVSSIDIERGLNYPFARNMSVKLTATF